MQETLEIIYIMLGGILGIGILIKLILSDAKKKQWNHYQYKNDPVHHCELYKEYGCSHVDGPLCDFPKCKMNDDYINACCKNYYLD